MGKRNSMRKRINVHFMAIAAAAIVITAMVSMLLFYDTLKKQVFDDLKAYANIIRQIEYTEQSENTMDSSGSPWDNETDLRKLEGYTEAEDLRITLVNEEGVVLYDSQVEAAGLENHKNRPEIAAALEKGEGRAVRTSDTVSAHVFYYATKLSNGDILRVGKDSGSIYQLWRNTVLVVFILSVVVLATCMMISYFLTKRLLVPIEKIAANLDGINTDNIYSELQPFVRTIKEQHINILDNARMRQEFTANVSHELKTPLTAISGYAELIESGMANEGDTRRFAGEIHHNSQRLLTLINDIIKLSELDENDHTFEVEQLDLYLAAQNCLDLVELSARKMDISLHLEGEHCTISANKNLIDELLYNLCSNAIRYNNKGGSVVVTVRPDGARVLLSVKDTGIGISKEHQERVFERFYRVDKSRSKQSGGTGLGLAIVNHIVAQHNAEIQLTSEVRKGTEIRIWF